MYGLSAATKRSGRCGEVAVSGGLTVTNNNRVGAIKIMWTRTRNLFLFTWPTTYGVLLGDKKIYLSKAAVYFLEIQDSSRDSCCCTNNKNTRRPRLTVNFFVLLCIALSL